MILSLMKQVLIRLVVLVMSKYTTEVRFICEQKAGLDESVGFNDVDDVISKSWNKIFTTKCSLFDEGYRSVICSKILKHYYTREIGFETVGLWQLWVNRRLEEIMPYYNELYKSAQLKFNPFYDVDYYREGNRKNDGTSETAGTSKNTQDNVSRDLYSETPQGALTGVENETYLTDARKVTQDNETNNEYTDNNITNTTEDYLEHVYGKMGTVNYSKMLNEYRTTLLNIDMQIIEEFSDLFMGLW